MSKHYEDRYYSREDLQDYSDYEEPRRRSSSRRRSTSRPRYRQEEHIYREQQITRSGSGSSISSLSDCERRNCGDRPMVRVPRDVIRAPTPPPVIQRVVERAPTPEPDIVERVIVRPQPQQLIERIIERPRTPPPRIIDKEICEPAPPPIVRTRVVKVDHSPRHYMNCNPVRYGSRQGVYDYDYGYENSFSQTYSTTEYVHPSNGYSSYPQAYPSQMTQISYQPTASMVYPSTSQYNGYSYSSYRPSGYSYNNNNVSYPRQY